MATPLEYSIAKGEGETLSVALVELKRNVQLMLEQEWQLQGGINTGSFTSGFVWATQAMFK